jgi:hypothetical protein
MLGRMTENPQNPATPEAPVQPAADDQPEKHPTDTTPRGNPPVDEEAVAKGEEILGRVKPY